MHAANDRGLSPTDLGYRVISARMKRMAFKQPSYGKIRAFYNPVFIYGLVGISRTCGIKPANASGAH